MSRKTPATRRSTANSPRPPDADRPISLVRDRATIKKELMGLENVIDAFERNDLDATARAALAMFDAGLSFKILNSAVSAANFLSGQVKDHPESYGLLLQRATDHGLPLWAYNAGNFLMDHARGPADYERAERYFKIAMSYAERPDLQAAAYVNYCPIVRDGLVTGKRDWQASVEIYEVAANMGLIRAMVNAGNMSLNLAQEGVPGYAERAAKWYQHALDFADSGRPHLDMESVLDLKKDALLNAQLDLAGIHIDQLIDNADPEYGIRLAGELAFQSEKAQRYYSIGLRGRLERLEADPGSPAQNWRSVLTALDWTFDPRIEQHVLTLPGLGVKRCHLVDRGNDDFYIGVISVSVQFVAV